MWKSHRKAVEPAFSSSNLKTFMSTFNEKSRIFVDVLGKYSNGKEFDIFKLYQPLTLENILNTSMGLDKNLQTEKLNESLKDLSA
jgi:cytochrome P450